VVKVVQPQPFREIIVTCPESSCVLPGEVAGGVFAALSFQQVLPPYCSECRCVSSILWPLQLHLYFTQMCLNMPIPAVARSEVWVDGRSLAGIAGSNSAGGIDSAIVMYNSAHVHEILDGTWRCQVRDLKCGRFSISPGPVFLNTVI
jgi:hypothetical protein